MITNNIIYITSKMESRKLWDWKTIYF